jgi:hypothetical protein
MKIEIEVEFRDGPPQTVRVRPGTQIQYERHFSKKDNPVRLGSSELSMEGVYWMAWHAMGHQKPFEQWWETIEGADLAVEDSDDSSESPLVEGQSSGPSSQPLSNPVPASPSTS